MYLTRMELDMKRRKTMMALTNRKLFHGAVESAFEGERKRRLWRIDRLGNTYYLLIVSEGKPDLKSAFEQFGPYQQEAYWETKRYDALLDRIESGSAWQFRLTANPTISSVKDKDKEGNSLDKEGEKKKRGTVYAHNVDSYQREWLKKKAEKNGFYIEDKNFSVVQSQWMQFIKGKEGSRVSFLGVTYEGILTVTDRETFVKALTEGIGREKAYGMGMLTIAKGALNGAAGNDSP